MRLTIEELGWLVRTALMAAALGHMVLTVQPREEVDDAAGRAHSKAYKAITDGRPMQPGDSIYSPPGIAVQMPGEPGPWTLEGVRRQLCFGTDLLKVRISGRRSFLTNDESNIFTVYRALIVKDFRGDGSRQRVTFSIEGGVVADQRGTRKVELDDFPQLHPGDVYLVALTSVDELLVLDTPGSVLRVDGDSVFELRTNADWPPLPLSAVEAQFQDALCSAGNVRRPLEATGNLEARSVRRAYEQGGIPAAAAVFGKYRSQEGFGNSISMSENVTGLTMASHVVLLGMARSQQSVLSADQRHINTEFVVRIQRLFKGGGTLRPGRDIVVNVPGGRLDFPNGTTAEVLLSSGEPPLRVGGVFLLFLEIIDNPAIAAAKGKLGDFIPTNGEGVFEISAFANGTPGKIVPYLNGTLVGDELLERGTPEEAFVWLDAVAQMAESLPGGKKLRQD